jgi:hypothetical protein
MYTYSVNAVYSTIRPSQKAMPYYPSIKTLGTSYPRLPYNIKFNIQINNTTATGI